LGVFVNHILVLNIQIYIIINKILIHFKSWFCRFVFN
jgi:hypothetical protein